VGFVRGYTSDGAPTLTVDCSTAAELEHEVKRLEAELAAAVSAAAAQLGGNEAESVSEAPAAVSAEGGAEQHLDSELRVDQVMTREVRTVRRNDSLTVAEELMRAGHFRHVLVLDEDGSLAGVLSRRDFVFSALSWQLGQGSKAHATALQTVVAKDLMQTQIVTVSPEASIAEAAGRMNEHKVGCLPVMDGPNLVGIITEGDFLALLAPR